MKVSTGIFTSILLSTLTAATPAEFTELVPLSSDAACNRCEGYLLPGAIKPSPETVYRIDSDLPEIFLSRGVLYATTPVLPPFPTKDGQDVPESQRRQRNTGFSSIDNSFEVFLYHMSNPGEEPRSRRVVVYTKNNGDSPITIFPRQIMEADGRMARFDGPETRLGLRQLGEEWDRVMEMVEIPAGQGRAVGWSPRLSSNEQEDATRSDFFTGTLRAKTYSDNGATPNLDVYVIAVAADIPVTELDAACEELLTVGAHSGEGAMDLLIPPPECHVRRVVGVSHNFLWESENVRLDASALDGEGIKFQMAAPMVQTVGCEIARQTQDMLLYPGYVHPDTVGNYMQEYMVTLTLANPSDEARRLDIRFGKQDADIGLVWQLAVDEAAKSRDEMKALPIVTEWAGAWRTDDLPDNTRSFFITETQSNEREPLVLAAQETRTVTLRFFPLGSSSLPFQIHILPMDEE